MGCGTVYAAAADLLEQSFSTLCGPMGCGTVAGPDDFAHQRIFQYPLRAYGLWNCGIRH